MTIDVRTPFRRAYAVVKRRLRRAIALSLCVLVGMPIVWSYGNAVTGPGTDSLGARSVEWLRQHHGAGAANTLERWWYVRHQPAKGGRPAAVLTEPPPLSTASVADNQPSAPLGAVTPLAHLPPPARLPSLAGSPLPDEGVWRPAGRLVDGVPAVYTTAVRPDAVHGGLATGVAWIDPTLTRASLFAGIQVPGGSWPHEAPVPTDQRPSLVAAFNAGFRMAESHGGYYDDHRVGWPLTQGAASLVIDDRGHVNVGDWGRDVQMRPNVVAVRQNLSLIVDGGAPVPGLDNNQRGRWGSTLGNRVLVWRSGVGVRADGALVYAAGNGLSVASLAAVLADAGAVRAMELDINSEWTRFFTYESPADNRPADVIGTKLVADMRSSPSLYLEPETRDFIALFAA